MRLIDADKLKETLLHYNYTTEHSQIFRWINEQTTVYDIDKEIYKKAVDDFVNACKEDILCQTFGLHEKGIERIAEQLKGGVENDL